MSVIIENSNDLISRADAIKMMACEMYAESQSQGYDVESWEEFIPEARAWMNDCPSAQPKQGKWIEKECDAEDKEDGWETVIVCSRCDFPATTFYSEDCESRTQIRTLFCPNCGARMGVEHE